MANILRETIIVMLIGFLLVSSSLLEAEAAEYGTSDEYGVTGRKLLNKNINHDAVENEKSHRSWGRSGRIPALSGNKYNLHVCSKQTPCYNHAN